MGRSGRHSGCAHSTACSVRPYCVQRERPQDSSMSIPTHFAILAHYSRMRQSHTNKAKDTIQTWLLTTPRTDQRTLYDGFLLHSTKVFGPLSKASRSPLLRTTIFSLLPEPSSLLLKHPVSNKQSTRESRSFWFCRRKAVFALSKAELRHPPSLQGA